MNKIMGLVASLVFAVVLAMVVGFVISSIKGYGDAYTFGSAVPYGLVMGFILFFFGQMVVADQK